MSQCKTKEDSPTSLTLFGNSQIWIYREEWISSLEVLFSCDLHICKTKILRTQLLWTTKETIVWVLAESSSRRNLTKGAIRGYSEIKKICSLKWIVSQFLVRNERFSIAKILTDLILVKQGSNTITRNSTESSLTVPFERTFRDLDVNRPTGGDELERFNFCGCGWPQHMLLPRGTEAGFQCQLFVMISNYADDRVNLFLFQNWWVLVMEMFVGWAKYGRYLQRWWYFLWNQGQIVPW